MIHMSIHRKHIQNILSLFIVCFIFSTTGTACGNAKINTEEEANEILNQYLLKGDSDTTIIKLEELLEQVKMREGENSKDAVMIMTNLGNVYSMLEKYDEAERYLQEARRIGENIKLNEWPIDDVYYILARVTNSQGNYEQGMQYSKEGLMWKNKIYGEESWQAGNSHLQMGFFYFEMEKFDEAETCIIKGLDATYEGIQEVSYLGGYYALGQIKLKQEKYEEALEALEEARTNYLGIYKGHSSKESKLTVLLPIYSNKADAYIGLGRYEDAMYTILRGYAYIAHVTVYDEMEIELKQAYIDKIFDIWKVLNNKESKSEFDSWLANDAIY